MCTAITRLVNDGIKTEILETQNLVLIGKCSDLLQDKLKQQMNLIIPTEDTLIGLIGAVIY